MSDAFWVALFGFAGVAVGQYFYHIRMMAAVKANTNITVAAATGRTTTPDDITQINDVVQAVAADKQETKKVAEKVAEKVVIAAETVKKALNGELEATITRIVSNYVAPLKEALDAHQQSDEANMLEIRNALTSIVPKG